METFPDGLLVFTGVFPLGDEAVLAREGLSRPVGVSPLGGPVGVSPLGDDAVLAREGYFISTRSTIDPDSGSEVAGETL
jgi:hypothetical protein